MFLAGGVRPESRLEVAPLWGSQVVSLHEAQARLFVSVRAPLPDYRPPSCAGGGGRSDVGVDEGSGV
jgi:hypothetical protein